ncbi:hypothetical protein ACIBP4_11655 [Micromonospora maritima]|uniref:HEAT repeat domain-containing protein n=1 Tax=Micromonospora maritima TaxID=986711 RepID=A0ABW7ZJC1_9ACTN
MPEPTPAAWYYAEPTTFTGSLQHGLGRGAHRARHDPQAPPAVLACVRRDYRWDRLVDERAVYLARLVRDCGLPTPPLLDLLREHQVGDDDNTFDNTLDVLEVLGRAGDPHAVDGLRGYVRDGPRWVDALQTMARDWPREMWDDLLPVARTRLERGDRVDDVLWRGRPWSDWAEVDDRIAGEVAAFRPRAAGTRPFAQRPTEDLLAMLRAGGRDRRTAALRELNRRGPQPALLDVVDELPVPELHGPLSRAVGLLGPLALPLARAWAAPPVHPMVWTAYLVLARHGDESDLPALLAAWDWLDRRTDDLCGYDALAEGVARIGGPAARAVVPRLRRAWFSPHTFERAAYLRAVVALAPGDTDPLLFEGLWDCESDVRRFAAEHAPLDDATRPRLSRLRDDPMETPEVRAAAAARLG